MPREAREGRSGDLQGWSGRKLLLHFLHFRHPWRSYAARGQGGPKRRSPWHWQLLLRCQYFLHPCRSWSGRWAPAFSALPPSMAVVCHAWLSVTNLSKPCGWRWRSPQACGTGGWPALGRAHGALLQCLLPGNCGSGPWPRSGTHASHAEVCNQSTKALWYCSWQYRHFLLP